MRDLGCHPDLFQLAVFKKKKKKSTKSKEKRRGGIKWKGKKQTKRRRDPFVEEKNEEKNRGIITSCSGSVNINNRNKQEEVFDIAIG